MHGRVADVWFSYLIKVNKEARERDPDAVMRSAAPL